MAEIPITEVRPGDLIFSYNIGQFKNDNLGLGEGKVRATHVLIVTDVHGAAVQVAHNVDSAPSFYQALPEGRLPEGWSRPRHWGPPARGMEGKKWQGTIINDLTIDADQISRARVVRCTGKPPLATAAAAWAKKWATLEVPYSTKRVGDAEADEGHYTSAEALVSAHRERFMQHGVFRAIKYAARRESYLSYPKSADDAGQGMFCSMFVAVAYQVAAMSPFVAAAPPHGAVRVSDKKANTGDWGEFAEAYGKGRGYSVKGDVASYGEYTKRLEPSALGAPPVSRKPSVEYRPSIEYWRPSNNVAIADFPWATHLTAGLMLDAKYIHPTGLFECLVADEDNWSDLGHVVGKHGYSESKMERGERLLLHGRQVEFQRNAFARGSKPFPIDRKKT